MGVKLENLPGQTSSTKPHSAGSARWTPWYAILIFQQSMMVYSVGFGFGFGFGFGVGFGFGFGFCFIILGDPGADSVGKGKSKRAEKYGTKKSKERREEPLGTMSYQTSSKRSPLFCLLIGQKSTNIFWHQTKLRKSETLNSARAIAQRRQTLSTRDRGYTATTNI